jgi:LysR family transcriptional regulator, low CO2-responsive transcriptional regulator
MIVAIIIDYMNTVTFRLLEVFKCVVETGSITAASHALSLSQPTVSLQLKKLSEIYDITLLETHHGSIALTDAGRAVYECATSVMESQRSLQNHIHALKGQKAGTFKIAVVSTAKYIVPQILKTFCKEYPDIYVQVKVGNSSQIEARMAEQQDDLYIVGNVPDDLEVEVTPFMQNPLKVVAPLDYSGPNHCHLSALVDHTFLLREEGSNTFNLFNRYCEQNNILLKDVLIIESNEAIQLAVHSGIGVSVLSEHTLAQTDKHRVQELNIIDFPLVSQWYAVSVVSRPSNGVLSAFKSHLQIVGQQQITQA